MDTLGTFVAQASQAFAFLCRDYGFASPEEAGEEYWRSLRYRNSTTEVLINYEIGTLPILKISRLQLKNARVMAAESVDLAFLVKRSGQESLLPRWEPNDVPDEILEGQLNFLAASLQHRGAEFLRGNFGESWPRLVSEQRAHTHRE